jgi:hypothetical protein
VFDGHPDEHAHRQPVELSKLRMSPGASSGQRVAREAQVLDELGLLVDDTVPTMRSGIENRCDALPAGFRAEVRARLLVLLDGDARARPRPPSKLSGIPAPEHSWRCGHCSGSPSADV